MDMERSGATSVGNKRCSSSFSPAQLLKDTAWRRCATRRALPAAVCVAATALAVVVLAAAPGSPNDMPDRWFSDDSTAQEYAPPASLDADQHLDGLLIPEFGERTCRSRYEFAAYRKKLSHKPSPYLLAKLRKQEALQKRCGPDTAPYRLALLQLKSGDGAAATDCRYLVSINYRGLGNRMLGMASAFLYAVLTERVLLVDRYKQDVGALFCEPFPGTTWLLPAGFPLGVLGNYDGSSKQSLGSMLKSKTLAVGADGNTSWTSADGGRRPPYVYLHLAGDYDFHDKLFFCDEHQRLLRGAPWLLMKTDNYFVPGLFLVPSFRDELGEMFPEKDAVFHHLGRYLFHPRNAVWHAVTSYYRSKLGGAGQRVGIQIRVFRKKQPPLQHVLDQVLSCVRREKLLPETTASSSSKNTSFDLAVLVTSLSPWYSERIRDEYGGGRVAGGVHQPSREGQQKWGDTAQDMRALSEIYLLSMCDVLVTTGFSTFGYVAQGLGGVRPWVMPRPPMWEEDTGTVPEPPCVREASVEPCFHSPSSYDCPARRAVNVGKVVPYVQRCEDVSWGIKLVNGSSQW